ncbi:unnamed protein product [Clavelina lepadiformis]|uniref:Uncharacterized protein n=1 Tax=Clavelina lepadiformis TaxID=159417 RepID=A0ABP0FS75_CLALP
MELFNMASLHFPKDLDLKDLKLSSSEAAIFCDVLRKQQNELEGLDLENCFSPGDVERLISAISEMPGKVKELDIRGNIMKDIPGPEFFATIEDRLKIMIDCFGYERKKIPNSSVREKIQLALDQLHDSRLRVCVVYDDGGRVYLIPHKPVSTPLHSTLFSPFRESTADVIMELRRGWDRNHGIL